MAGSTGESVAPCYSRAVTKGSKDAGKKHFKKLVEKISEARSQGTSGRSGDQDQEGNQ